MVIGDKSAVSCDCVKLCNLYFIGQFFKIILDFFIVRKYKKYNKIQLTKMMIKPWNHNETTRRTTKIIVKLQKEYNHRNYNGKLIIIEPKNNHENYNNGITKKW
jgi:hypothetical protein